jgi:DNA-binding GntR family transcriptional regulator
MAKAARKRTMALKTRMPKKADRRPRGTGASYVYDNLKGQILHLELMPGTLLDETELGRRFGVSRSPVREALIRLSAEGLVQNLRNRTSIVAQFDIAGLPAYFDAMILIYRITARLAAHNPNPSIIARIRTTLDEHEEALRQRNIRDIIRLNHEFHTGIAEMAGNPYIASWLHGILAQGQRLLSLYGLHIGSKDDAQQLLHTHRKMIDAILCRDPEAAEIAGREDAQSLIDEFMDNLAKRPTAFFQIDADAV